MSATWRTHTLLDGLRRRLDDIVDQQTRDLTRAWVDAWNEIEPDLRMALLEQLVPGERLTGSQLRRSLRLRNALLVVADRLERLADQSGVRITADLQDVIDAAGTAQAAIIDSQLPPGSHMLGGLDQWTRVNPAEIEAMVARVTQQITSLSRPISAETYKAMRAELLRGIASGSSPRRTADRMLQRTKQRFNGGLTRALVISRTEMLDAHRSAAALGQAQHADVLAGWAWLTRLDARTCRACLSMAGRVFPLSEPGPHGHQQCRCVRLPKTKPWRELGFDIDEPADQTPDPDAWFRTLTPSQQRRMLGRDGYRAWLAGDFPREEWARRRGGDGWRDSYVPADPGGPNASGDGTIPPGKPPAPPTPGQPDEGDPFANIGYAGWIVRHPDLSKLSDDERVAIQHYASSGYNAINGVLRGEREGDEHVLQEIADIRSGLSKYPLIRSVRVSRETELRDFGVREYADLASLVDHVLEHRPFLSTSFAEDPPSIVYRERSVWMHIMVPFGTPALAIIDDLVEPGQEAEQELLVIDARRLLILRVEFDRSATRWRVWAQVLGD